MRWRRRGIMDFLPFGNVPQSDRVVGATRCEQLSVGRKPHGVDPFIVPFEQTCLFASRHIPDMNVRVVAAAGDELPVRRQGQTFQHYAQSRLVELSEFLVIRNAENADSRSEVRYK